jgi:ribonuclease HII
MLPIRHTADEIIEVGIDEAGRGSLWGPMYAAAVIWTDETNPLTQGIKDSKKLSQNRREVLAEYIKDYALDWSIGIVTAKEIDELGMTKSNQLAFSRALENLQVMPGRIIVDGCLSVPTYPWSMIPQVVEPEADNKYIPVAAASILAKTEHDNWVKEFCETNENIASRYDLLSNKGYGTAKHRAGIIQWGEHSLHRKLFLRKLYSQNSVLEVKDS